MSFSNRDPVGSVQGQPAKARLKWFNPAKGFGFVSPVDGADDAFLHVSILHRAGLQELGDQAELLCEIAHGPKGPQVMTIIEILDHGVVGAKSARAPLVDGFVSNHLGVEHDTGGIVKWYKVDKGFGFITIEDTTQDVFIHKTVLQKSGLATLEPGQPVQMRYHDVVKGREATWVALRD
jgi:CspA family cold shock protein